MVGWVLLAGLALGGEAVGVPCPAIGESGEVLGRTLLAHQTSAQLMASEAQSADLELRAPRDQPPGGVIQLQIERVAEDLAATENHTLIVFDAIGNESLRRVLPPSSPAANRQGTWKAGSVAELAKPLLYPIDVHVVDGIMRRRCSWTVQSDGKVTLGVAIKAPKVAPVPPLP